MEFISLWLLLAEAVQLTWSFQLSKLPLKLKRKKTNQPNLNSLTNTVLSLSQVSAVELAKEKTCLFPQVVILTLIIWSKSEESLKQMKRTCAVKWLTSTLINKDKLPTLDVYWKEVIKPQLRKPDLTKNWQQFRRLRQLKKDLQRSSVDLFRLKVILSQLEYILNQRSHIINIQLHSN
jgi:hypothetical protein